MPDDVPAELADYRVVVSWPVQWGDQDAYGHVNNTVYFRWVETARIKYMERLFAEESPAAGGGPLSEQEPVAERELEPILAAISCNYRRQVTYPDTVRIAMRVTRIGRSSIRMEHKLWSDAQQAVVADGEGTVVTFDYAANKSLPVPAAMRAAIVRLEARPIEGA